MACVQLGTSKTLYYCTTVLETGKSVVSMSASCCSDVRGTHMVLGVMFKADVRHTITVRLPIANI